MPMRTDENGLRIPTCPVCDTDTVNDKSVLDYGTIAESTESCPNGCYYYEYMYGGTSYYIGGIDWHEHHTDSANISNEKDSHRRLWINLLKQDLTTMLLVFKNTHFKIFLDSLYNESNNCVVNQFKDWLLERSVPEIIIEHIIHCNLRNRNE